MENFAKYIPPRESVNPFKLVVQNGGFFKSLPNSPYPDSKHPSHHYFDYAKGRRLDEYQILYIRHGNGIFESESSGIIDISEDDMLILFPGEWHRYKPDENTGWSEYWVGFTGNFMDFFAKSTLITPQNPIVKIYDSEQVVILYNQIMNLLKSNSPGDLILLSGVTTNLLSYALAFKQRQSLGYSSNVNKIIGKAKVIIEENWKEEISPESISEQLHVSYSWFRKNFKKYVGISAKEYSLNLKLNKAKELLLFSTLPIKEIAFETGFNSQYHFSKIFKTKMQISPNGLRLKVLKKSDNFTTT